MKKFIWVSVWLLSIAFSVSSCDDSNKIEPPQDLIPKEQMVHVLSDICKVEARFQRRLTINNINNTEMVSHNYNVIFEANNVTLMQFKDSYSYYQSSPETMQELFDSVIVVLTKEQAAMGIKNEVQPPMPLK